MTHSPREKKQRLDVWLVERGLAESRERAQALVLAHRVRVDGKLAAKPGERVGAASVLEVSGPDHPYVGRGGLKLAGALDRFGVDPGGRICLDVGASTGGFTDCLLQRGAAKVYALDVGSGQLHYRLRRDSRVVVLEGRNARYLEASDLPEAVTLITVDVSFISLRLILPRLPQLLAPRGDLIPLVKPQFEVGRREVGKGGIVRDAGLHRRVIREILCFASTLPLRIARRLRLAGGRERGKSRVLSPSPQPRGGRFASISRGADRGGPSPMKLPFEFDVVGIVAKPDASNSRKVLRRLGALLKQRGIRYLADSEAARLLGKKSLARSLPVLCRSVKLLVVLGGDGTLLGVARKITGRPVPILGVNLGQLGFLTETAQEELEAFFSRILEGKFSVEERMMLHVQVLRGRRVLAESRSLNDAVISKSAIARILELNVRIDGRFVAVYHADGIIVATPTGSTAYSLSAGGPIVLPDMRAFCITPICPHALTNRPLVVPDSVTIQVTVESASRDATCTLDGQVGLPVRAGDRLRIRRSPTGLTLIVPPERNFFDVLRKKLRWGAR